MNNKLCSLIIIAGLMMLIPTGCGDESLPASQKNDDSVVDTGKVEATEEIENSNETPDPEPFISKEGKFKVYFPSKPEKITDTAGLTLPLTTYSEKVGDSLTLFLSYRDLAPAEQKDPQALYDHILKHELPGYYAEKFTVQMQKPFTLKTDQGTTLTGRHLEYSVQGLHFEQRLLLHGNRLYDYSASWPGKLNAQTRQMKDHFMEYLTIQ